jgi:IclR family transcriptional regulator, acetate operon repressor
MSGVMQRTLAILERLAHEAHGLSLAALADDLAMPRSAAHRLLTELSDLGYVSQSRERGDYRLTTKLITLGLAQLRLGGVSDVVLPIVNRLAQDTGELVRLGLVDVDRLTWVVTAQGAASGLRYDPDAGSDANLSCTSSGLAWLSTLSDEEALALVRAHGFPKPGAFGPNAPTDRKAFLALLHAARASGHAITEETHRAGVSSIAVPVMGPALQGDQPAKTLAVLVISGPTVRLSRAHMLKLWPLLEAAAREIGVASVASPLMGHALHQHRPKARAE